MADISITQPHRLTLKKARAAAQTVADKMAEEYEFVSIWEGDVLSFSRSGVSGTLAILEKEARLDITLGFMLKGFSTAIESKVTQNMEKVFAG